MFFYHVQLCESNYTCLKGQKRWFIMSDLPGKAVESGVQPCLPHAKDTFIDYLYSSSGMFFLL